MPELEEGLAAPSQAEAIRALFADVLGVSDVGPGTHFLEAGGDLAAATRLVGRIRAELGAVLTLREFLKKPTPEGLAARFGGPRQPSASTSPGPTPPPPAADAAIHAEITDRLRRITPTLPADSAAVPTADPTAEPVLLTGATGFVGAFVLAHLLARGGHVTALIRGGEPRRAELVRHLDRLGLWQTEYAARLTTVAGDLAEPALGLDRYTHGELAQSIGRIIHCAAWVNHVLPYPLLAAANAHSAASILELAVTGRRKPVTHVSTRGVLIPENYPPDAEILAGPVVALPPEADGYGRSKAVAEAYFARAADLGAAVTVVRIPGVFGDRDQHQLQPNDALWSWIKATIMTGRYPSSYDLPGNELFQAVPADVIARVVVDLAQPSDQPGCRFVNAVPNRACTTVDFIAGLHAAGHPVRPLDDREWHLAVSRLDVDDVWVAAVAARLATLPDIGLPRRFPRFSVADTPAVSEVIDAAAIATPEDIAGYVRSLRLAVDGA